MKIVIATDSFKGSLTSMEAGLAIKEGILKKHPEAKVSVFPLADGGEGTIDALCFNSELKRRELLVSDPFFRPVKAYYAFSKSTAYIEMAKASGLTRLVTTL